jgi:hypothetical protein
MIDATEIALWVTIVCAWAAILSVMITNRK